MKLNFILLYIFILTIQSFGQSLIVGIPSADVAEKNHLEITHETQWIFWEKPQKWNSFNFLCFGLGKGLELTSTMNNIDSEGSKNFAFGIGAKKAFNLFSNTDKYERKLIVGGNGLYGTKNNDFGVWTYSLLSFRLPNAKTRFTGGVSYGNSQVFGFYPTFRNDNIVLNGNNKFVFLGGIEQPIWKNVSFICDWFSGTHDLASFIPAIQIDINHHVFILGYKFPNNQQSGRQALIIEFMISLPTKSKKSMN